MPREESPIAFVKLHLPDKDLVFQRRTVDAPTSPSKLQFFGGHLDAGESYYEAAVRELAEETDLPVTDMEFEEIGEFYVPKGNNVYRRVGLVAAGIDTAAFRDLEGQGTPEVYGHKMVLTRPDLVTSTRFILERLIEE